MQKNVLFQVSGTSYKQMTVRLLEEAELCSVIPETKPVLLKPNLVSPVPADLGATTHPEVVEGVLEYLFSHGRTDISILEGSWVGDRTEDAFEICGVRALAERFRVPLSDAKAGPFTEILTPAGPMRVAAAAARSFLIDLPVLKGHCQTRMTCALKNLKGLLPDGEKRRFHREGLHRPVAALGAALPAGFILADAICGDPDFEGGGHPVKRDLLYAGFDPVLADAYGAALLGLTPADVAYIGLAEEYGAGCADLSKAEVRVLREKEGEPSRSLAADEALSLVTSGKSSGHAAVLSENVQEVDSCSACYEMLLSALDRLRSEGITPPEGELLAIGQGYRGQSGEAGIGNCTLGFAFTVPGCPPDEESICSALKARWKP